MDEKLERVLFDNYPLLYPYTNPNTTPSDPNTTPEIAHKGIDCGNGWYPLIDFLSRTLEKTNNEREDTIQAIQVEEDDGRLVFLTDTQTPSSEKMISMIEVLASMTCEQCSTMNGVQQHKKNSTTKTLCESCALDWRDVDTEVEIWRFTTNCHKCDTPTPVVYPRGLGGVHGGTWDTVGPELSTKPYCTIEQIYSNVQEQLVWGNICQSCGAYQGNYYIYEEAIEKVEQANGWYPLHDFDCVDIISRS